MKKLIVISALLFFVYELNAQQLIGITKHPDATSNPNQRKIVRDSDDNIYIVYQDIVNEVNVIKFIYFDRETEIWSESVTICEGENPALGIDRDNIIYMVYHTGENLRSIHIKSYENLMWNNDVILANNINSESPCPQVDVGFPVQIYVSWKNENKLESVKIEDSVISQIYTSVDTTNIVDYAFATDLAGNSEVYLSYQNDNGEIFHQNSSMINGNWYQPDSNTFLGGTPPEYYMIGTSPRMSVNYKEYTGISYTAVIYIDTVENVRANIYTGLPGSTRFEDYSILIDSPVSFLAIDDVLEPVGYSFLFVENNVLYHATGQFWGACVMRDTIAENPIHPQIAYKQFRGSVIDVIWMQELENDEFGIYYGRYNKMPIADAIYNPEINTEQITAFPNPFETEISVNLYINKQKKLPVFSIYDLNGRLINKLEVQYIENLYKAVWNGANTEYNSMQAGTFILYVECDDKVFSRLIIKIK